MLRWLPPVPPPSRPHPRPPQTIRPASQRLSPSDARHPGFIRACLPFKQNGPLFQLAEWCSWFVSPSSPAPFSIPAKSVCSLTSAPVMLISPYCPCSCSVSLPLPIFQDSVYTHLFCEAISLLHLHLSLHSLNYYLYLVPHSLALSCPSRISCFFILSYLLEFKPCKSHD